MLVTSNPKLSLLAITNKAEIFILDTDDADLDIMLQESS